MERMREHVFKEADVNKDGLISFQEFLDQTKRDEYRRDQGWDTVDQQPQYTHDEYLEFERRRQEEIQRMINEGRLPAHPNMPHGYYPNGDPNPQYQQQHPNEIPHGYQQNAQHPQQFQNQPPPPPQQQKQHYQQAGNVQQHQQDNHQQQMQQQYQQQQHAQQQVNQNMGAQQAAQAAPQQANHNLQNNQVYEQVHNQQQQKQQNQGNQGNPPQQVPTNNNIPKPIEVNVPSQAAPQAVPVQTQQDQQKAPPAANIPNANPPQVQQMNH